MTLGSHQTAVGKSQSWITPKWIIDRLGPFDLDPCAAIPQPWPCAKDSLEANGLIRQWWGRVWLNPPFDRYEVDLWIEKMAAHQSGIALLHVRTEAKWFEPVWQQAHAILFLADRLHFHHPDGRRAAANSGAPACLAAFSAYDRQRLEQSRIQGYCVTKWKSQ